jgi:hypothetical protein
LRARRCGKVAPEIAGFELAQGLRADAINWRWRKIEWIILANTDREVDMRLDVFGFKSLASLAAGFVLATTIVGSASGMTITYTATGEVTAVSGGVSSVAAVGDIFQATWLVDSTVTARTGGTSNQASFDALTALSLLVGGYVAASGGPQEIQVDNDVAGFPDRYGVVSTSLNGLAGPSVNGHALNLFFLNLTDSTKTAFSDALILPLGLNLESFDGRVFAFHFDGSQSISGIITDLSVDGVAAVPSPIVGAGLPGLILASGGLLALAWRRRKAIPAAT